MESGKSLKGKLRCFIKDTEGVLKLVISPEERQRCKRLAEFEEIDPTDVARFITSVQSVLTGINYDWYTHSIEHVTSFASFSTTNIIIIPEELENVIKKRKRVIYKLGDGNNDEIYPEFKDVNYMAFSYEKKYKMYDVLRRQVDKQLIDFNPQFLNIVNGLIEECLANPNISVTRAMQVFAWRMEESQPQRRLDYWNY